MVDDDKTWKRIHQDRLWECMNGIDENPDNLLERVAHARKTYPWKLPDWAEQTIERGKKKLLEKELKRIEEGELDVPQIYIAEELLGPTGSDRLEKAIQTGERALLDKYINRIRNGEVHLVDHGDCSIPRHISISARSLAKECVVGEDILENALKEGYPKKFDEYLQSIEEGDTYWAPNARELAEKGGLDAGKVDGALGKWAKVVEQKEVRELKEDLRRIRTGDWTWLIEPTKKLATKYSMDPAVVDATAEEGVRNRRERLANKYAR